MTKDNHSCRIAELERHIVATIIRNGKVYCGYVWPSEITRWVGNIIIENDVYAQRRLFALAYKRARMNYFLNK